MTTKPETVFEQIAVLPDNHSIILLKFKDWLIEEEDSSPRNAANYLKVLKLFSADICQTEFKDITKDQILDFLNKRKKSPEDDPDKKWVRTWNDYLARLIGFYRWLYNHDKVKDRDDWETPAPFCDIKKKKNKRDSSYSPNDVWELEDLLLVVKYCDNVRDKFIFAGGWDLSSRNHEITKVKIKDIVMKEKYAEISTSWDTKTGIRTCPIIVGFPYLRDLLNTHPFSNDPNAFLIINKTTSKPLNPDSLWTISDTLKKKIIQLIEDGVIKGQEKERLTKLLQKPWNPYLVTRHSSLTEKTDYLSDQQMKQAAGWTVTSDRAKVYVHRSGKAIINPMLEEYGIKPKTKKKTTRNNCQKCGFVNTPESKICTKCNFVLDTRGWEQVKLEEEEKEKSVNLKIHALQNTNNDLQKQLNEMKKKQEELEKKWMEKSFPGLNFQTDDMENS